MPVDNTAREVELMTFLNGALIGSREFRGKLLERVDAYRSESADDILARVEYQPPGASCRYDIYLYRDDPPLHVVLEIKRSDSGLREDQLREYLAQLKIIQPDKALRRRRNAPKSAKLVVVTGATETPGVIDEFHKAGNGFLREYLEWVSWYELADMLADLEGGADRPHCDQLMRLLASQGYMSHGSTLPRLKTQEKLLSRLSEADSQAAGGEDLEVLEAALGRMEYQMAKLGFGVPVHVTVKGRKRQSSRIRTTKVGHPLVVFGQNIKGVGRMFVPNPEARAFDAGSKRTAKQDYGVGIAFSVRQRAWIAFIKPQKGHPLTPGFTSQRSTKDRPVLSHTAEGVYGWLLKGCEKQPAKTARFLAKTWNEYRGEVPES